MAKSKSIAYYSDEECALARNYAFKQRWAHIRNRGLQRRTRDEIIDPQPDTKQYIVLGVNGKKYMVTKFKTHNAVGPEWLTAQTHLPEELFLPRKQHGVNMALYKDWEKRADKRIRSKGGVKYKFKTWQEAYPWLAK